MQVTSAQDTATERAKNLAQGFAARAGDADARGALPAEDVQALRDSGFLSLSVPKSHGGAGASLEECVEVLLELSKGSTSTALVAAMQFHIFGHARETQPWPKSIFAHFCEEAVRGKLFNSAASEPKLGSPSRGGLPQTNAVLEGDTLTGTLTINGHKTWVTGGESLDHLLVGLRFEDASAVVWVPSATPGVSWRKTWGEGLSVRASDSHDVVFENVRVPADHLIQHGTAQKNKAGPNMWFPMLIAATYLGTALAARDTVIRYALERVPTALGRPIATLPNIQRQVGELDVVLQAAQTLLLNVAAGWTGDEERGAYFPRVAAAKHFATETAIEATDKALRIAGGAGVGRELPLERLFRDVRAGLMHPPSGDSALELIGKSAIASLEGSDA